MLHGNEHIVKHKIGLLNLAEELANVSRTCKIWACPETSFAATKLPWTEVDPVFRQNQAIVEIDTGNTILLPMCHTYDVS